MDGVPRFMDPWPIVMRDGSPVDKSCKVLFRKAGYVLALFRPFGKGGMVFISDSRFFSNQNIAGLWGYWPGNLKFLHHVFREHLRTDPDAVQDRFPSPEKPR